MSASAPGTRPEGIGDEREAASYVRRMFSQIAPRYDLLNHLLSLNLDKLWRARTARAFAHILARADARVLDLCCGTGDLTFALRALREKGLTQRAQRAQSAQSQRGHDEVETIAQRAGAADRMFVGCDFAHPMLTRAREKAGVERSVEGGRLKPAPTLVSFAEADALQLPFGDGEFDLVTAAFGFRNLANYEAGLREIHRVLKPGGEAGILEFSAPRNSVFAAMYKMYFTKVLPRVGGAVSGSGAAYSYLPASVMKFPSPEELAAQMRACGFRDARFASWTFGVVALHRGVKG